MINRLNLILGLGLFLVSLAFFVNPELDIKISEIFYWKDKGFALNHNIFAMAIFRAIPTMTILFAISLIVYAFRSYFYSKNFAKSYLAISIIISLAIGPGIIVNSILKDNFGRARPKQIQEFGGQKLFTPVYIKTDQCIRNCSFSSGHAAAAFSFSSIAYFVAPQYSILTYFLGIVFGFIVGFGRLVQGGHFASDVLVSGSIVLLINFFVTMSYFKIFKKSLST